MPQLWSDKRLQLTDDTNSPVIFIPGGTAGVGLAVATALLSSGYRVAIAGRSKTDTSPSSRNLHYYQCDTRKADEIRATLDTISTSWAPVSAIVNCVGPFRRIPLQAEQVENWRDTIESNLTSAFSLYQQAVPYLISHQRSRIISFAVAKADQLLGRTHITAYYCAKAALIALTRAYAVNYAKNGLTANIISLGDVDSKDDEKREDRATDKREQKWPSLKIPAGRLGKTSEVASLVSYLLKQDAQYINGAIIDTSGAWSFA